MFRRDAVPVSSGWEEVSTTGKNNILLSANIASEYRARTLPRTDVSLRVFKGDIPEDYYIIKAVPQSEDIIAVWHFRPP
jgi:hypothetical protein